MASGLVIPDVHSVPMLRLEHAVILRLISLVRQVNEPNPPWNNEKLNNKIVLTCMQHTVTSYLVLTFCTEHNMAELSLLVCHYDDKKNRSSSTLVMQKTAPLAKVGLKQLY